MHGAERTEPDGLAQHGPERLRERRPAAAPRIKSISHLRKEVERHFGKLSSQDTEALVGWFNRNFFRLEKR